MPLSAADLYRKTAAELDARAAKEISPAIAAQLRHIGRAYRRLARLAESNSHLDVWAEFGRPPRLNSDDEGTEGT
ncbi:MAG TPA: hypothetical protein VHA37_01725 [Candidatus Saccharimonadales bacterium]|nr:hypothetical protein [Candidatus Saccharimonadales bacterium]